MTNNYRICNCHVLTPSETNTRSICHVLTPSELLSTFTTYRLRSGLSAEAKLRQIPLTEV